MSTGADETTERRPTIEGLRLAVGHMFGAERRLRSREHSRSGELTHAQLRALATLGREQEMTAGQLARSADLNPATVTAMLDQLEAANVVQRHRSMEDRRVCNVSLTPQGRQLLERKLTYWYSAWEEQFAGFSDRDLETTARVISQITEIYEALSVRLGAPAEGETS
jgi:MarR family transcriptional regulator, organic hydroperoxide resistance regulator